ncbi:MAG: hypothetical protein ABH831_02350 [Candidatus Nealsonbacteria bacterium]
MKQDNTIKQLRNAEFKINKNLYFICGVITVFTMVMLSVEFFSGCAFPSTRIPLFYLGILIIYSLHKELIRWLGERKAERQGEYFVYGWIAFTSLIYLINFTSKQHFSLAGCEAPLTSSAIITLEVLTIFLLTRASKFVKLFLNRNKI